jgi:hypothetical protein
MEALYIEVQCISITTCSKLEFGWSPGRRPPVTETRSKHDSRDSMLGGDSLGECQHAIGPGLEVVAALQ